jgi:predicted HicB family RNase H-like nuclease
MASKPSEKLLTVRIPVDLFDAAMETANREERNLSQVVRFALRWYVESRKMVPPNFR